MEAPKSWACWCWDRASATLWAVKKEKIKLKIPPFQLNASNLRNGYGNDDSYWNIPNSMSSGICRLAKHACQNGWRIMSGLLTLHLYPYDTLFRQNIIIISLSFYCTWILFLVRRSPNYYSYGVCFHKETSLLMFIVGSQSSIYAEFQKKYIQSWKTNFPLCLNLGNNLA
jgi:hypothetical protein